MIRKVLYAIAALALVAGNLAIGELASHKNQVKEIAAGKNNCPVYYGCPTPPPPPPSGGGNGGKGGVDNTAPHA